MYSTFFSRLPRLPADAVNGLAVTLIVVATLLPPTPAVAATLDDVRDRGRVNCGVNIGLAGFAEANSLGEYRGFDVDLCRAVAVAALNDASAVEYVPLSVTDRFKALQDGRIDLLSRNTTWTLQNDALHGSFAGVSFFDGQGFMVHKKSGIRSALELDNAPICVAARTAAEHNVEDFFINSEIRYQPVFAKNESEVVRDYLAEKCVVYSADYSALAAYRSSFDKPDAHVILPEIISKEPHGPMVRQNDSVWENVVRWTLNCMINAEEMGVDSSNVDTPQATSTPWKKHLLGLEGKAGEELGLDEDWCRRVIRDVGNYAESYARHLGENTSLELPRGINQLWTNGGMIYAPPIR